MELKDMKVIFGNATDCITTSSCVSELLFQQCHNIVLRLSLILSECAAFTPFCPPVSSNQKKSSHFLFLHALLLRSVCLRGCGCVIVLCSYVTVWPAEAIGGRQAGRRRDVNKWCKSEPQQRKWNQLYLQACNDCCWRKVLIMKMWACFSQVNLVHPSHSPTTTSSTCDIAARKLLVNASWWHLYI